MQPQSKHKSMVLYNRCDNPEDNQLFEHRHMNDRTVLLQSKVLARYSLPKTKESDNCTYFLPTYVNNQDVNAHWAAQNAYTNVTSLLINTQ